MGCEDESNRHSCVSILFILRCIACCLNIKFFIYQMMMTYAYVLLNNSFILFSPQTIFSFQCAPHYDVVGMCVRIIYSDDWTLWTLIQDSRSARMLIFISLTFWDFLHSPFQLANILFIFWFMEFEWVKYGDLIVILYLPILSLFPLASQQWISSDS